MTTIRPNARVRIVRMHPRHKEITVQPVDHDGTHDGPEVKMAWEVIDDIYALYKAGQIVDLWTTDGFPIDRRAIGRSTGKIYALSYPEVIIGKAAALAIAANSMPATHIHALGSDELADIAERFMRSRVGEVRKDADGQYGMPGNICMSANTRGLLYTIRTVDAGEITIAIDKLGSLTTMFDKKTDNLDIKWNNQVLIIAGLDISESAADGLVGKPVSTVVDNPLLTGTIEQAFLSPLRALSTDAPDKSQLTMVLSHDPVGSYAPGSQWIRR